MESYGFIESGIIFGIDSLLITSGIHRLHFNNKDQCGNLN